MFASRPRVEKITSSRRRGRRTSYRDEPRFRIANAPSGEGLRRSGGCPQIKARWLLPSGISEQARLGGNIARSS
jgi:hypothetical protein